MSTATESQWIELGRIGSPFGIGGGLHVDSFTDPPESLFDYEVWNVKAGSGARTTHRVVEAREQGTRFVVFLEGVEDRDAAARLTNAMIEVPRRELPPTSEREFYQADLIGLRVRNLEGAELGTLTHFIDVPANPVMVVKGASEHLVPAVPQHLKQVDLVAGQIVVDWPETLD